MESDEIQNISDVHHLLNLPFFACRDHLTFSSKLSDYYVDCHASSKECSPVMLPTVTD